MGDARGQLAEGGQAGGVGQLLLQAPVVLLAAHPFGDVPGHADHLHHTASIGLANSPAGGLEPQVMAIPVADAVTQGEVAVLLQRPGIALHQFITFLGVDQLLDAGAAQLLRPVAQQSPGRRGGVEEFAARCVPGDEVGGVLDDQTIQPSRLLRLLKGTQGLGGIPGTALHMAVAEGKEAPQQLPSVGHRHAHILDGTLLFQHRLDQMGEVFR